MDFAAGESIFLFVGLKPFPFLNFVVKFGALMTFIQAGK